MTKISQNTPPLRCGVVGVGYLGQHHARIYANLPNCQLVGIYDTHTERAKEIATLYNTHVFDNIESLGKACDAISIAVPTDQHAAVALKLLNTDCHLLIEKPICSSLEEAEMILNQAKKNNKLVQVGHIEHFNPVMSFLENAAHNPRYITADRLAPFQPRGTEVGVVLDLMIHDIGVILSLVKSPIERIDAVGICVLSKTEDIANARITFKNGCVANINTSRVSLKKVREIRIFQPQTYLSLDFMNQKGHLLKVTTTGLVPEEIPLEKGEPLALELASFVDCVRTHEQPKVDGFLGKMALEVAIHISELIQKNQMMG